MGFGISKLIKYLSLRIIALEIIRLITTYKYRKNNLKLLIGCDLIDSTIGKNNFFGENVTFINSLIDNYSYIGNNSKIKNTKIGKFCSIGPNVQVVLGKHPLAFVSSHPAFYANNKPFKTFSKDTCIDEYDNVIIGNDVWIAEGVLIPGGVVIGNGAIITARAVVTKDVEPYSIVGGIPAKHIKYRFDMKTINLINQSEWWNWDEVDFNLLQKSFLNPEVFIDELLKNISKKKHEE